MTAYCDASALRSALGNRVRRGEATPDYATALVSSARAYFTPWNSVDITAPDIADAGEMLGNFTLGLRLPDAIHIAVAMRLNMTLVSTDVRQVLGAKVLGVVAIDPSKVPPQ